LLDIFNAVHIHAHALHHAFLLSGIHAFMHTVLPLTLFCVRS
jgi:hypothetical protein